MTLPWLSPSRPRVSLPSQDRRTIKNEQFCSAHTFFHASQHRRFMLFSKVFYAFQHKCSCFSAQAFVLFSTFVCAFQHRCLCFSAHLFVLFSTGVCAFQHCLKLSGSSITHKNYHYIKVCSPWIHHRSPAFFQHGEFLCSIFSTGLQHHTALNCSPSCHR